MVDWTDILVPGLLGLTVPFMNGRAAARMNFWRYCLALWLVLVTFMLIGMILDFASDAGRLRPALPSSLVFGVSSLNGYGLARFAPLPGKP
jgi:hypothetical protein